MSISLKFRQRETRPTKMTTKTDNFTSDLNLGWLTTMEQKLAVQMIESTLLKVIIDNDNGVVVALRAMIQQEPIAKRIELISKIR